jgi:hypothetical protein
MERLSGQGITQFASTEGVHGEWRAKSCRVLRHLADKNMWSRLLNRINLQSSSQLHYMPRTLRPKKQPKLQARGGAHGPSDRSIVPTACEPLSRVA